MLAGSTERYVFTVSSLNSAARELLECQFPAVWVEGEISNFSCPSSGHWYFSLKDAGAQLRCAMFKGNNMRLGFVPKDGQHVIVRGRLSLYPARGDYQLIADVVEDAGEGALKRAYELLFKKLQAEGLFEERYKKSIPAIPSCLGVITSPTGAAIRDILHVLKRRFPALPVIIYPTAVQGEAAAPQIVKAIERANQHKACDVLIVARGGGSLEDLWAFNEEIVARAIFASELPIVTGVGHEIDFTIADFVSDKRAPTPSAAAEIVSPDQEHWLLQLNKQLERLFNCTKQKLFHKKAILENAMKRLQLAHPQRKLQELSQRLDHVEFKLKIAIENHLKRYALRMKMLEQALYQHNPQRHLTRLKEKLSMFSLQLERVIVRNLQSRKQSLAALARTLDTISPLATLGRGYAIAFDERGKNVQSVKDIKVSQKLKLKLKDGELACNIIEIT